MSGGVSLVSFCHIYVRMRTLWISPFLKEAAEMSLCLSPRLTLYQFMKFRLKPEVLKRQQIDGVLKNWWESGTIAPQKKKEEANQSAYLKKKKKIVTIKITKGVSLFYFDKKERAVSDSVSWEIAVSALREPQIISLWDLGVEFWALFFLFLMR